MKILKKMALKLWRDESGQGTAEYVLILVGVLAVGIVFKGQITKIVTSKMEALGASISGFKE